jgi:hypothetical protein
MRYYAVPLLLGVLLSLPVPLSDGHAQQPAEVVPENWTGG